MAVREGRFLFEELMDDFLVLNEIYDFGNCTVEEPFSIALINDDRLAQESEDFGCKMSDDGVGPIAWIQPGLKFSVWRDHEGIILSRNGQDLFLDEEGNGMIIVAPVTEVGAKILDYAQKTTTGALTISNIVTAYNQLRQVEQSFGVTLLDNQ